MVIVIAILFVVLGLSAAAAYLWQRPQQSERAAGEFEPQRFRSLFHNEDSSHAIDSEVPKSSEALRVSLIEQARAGSLDTLTEAAVDARLYTEVLDALVEAARDSNESIRGIASFISKNPRLRSNKHLAEKLIALMPEEDPDKRLITAAVHIAALSDDAAAYENAIELTTDLWLKGKLTGFTPEELMQLFDSQFWILAPEARSGGAGFALKRKLAGVRRQLATVTPAR